MERMNEQARRLILSAELAGLLHDLGKVHPGFAGEKLDGGTEIERDGKHSTGISENHGKILENGRAYPTPAELNDAPDHARLLATLSTDPHWAAALALPADWTVAGTIQAQGLGAPLRQHHATNSFAKEQLSFLGDLYTFGADIRDSALDKGSGGTASGKQHSAAAEIADAFGMTRSRYSATALAGLWPQTCDHLTELLLAPGAAAEVALTRNGVLEALKPLFEQALGETRRPTNDVTLWHHSHSSASFFKAAVAEGVLRGSFKQWQNEKGEFDLERIGRVRFRLLGVRWDWTALTRSMLSPTALVSLSDRRREVVDGLRELFEVTHPIGNVIYADDDGVLVLAPGFHEDNPDGSEASFDELVLRPLAAPIADCIAELGVGTPFRLCWSGAALYLTDYPEALGLAADSPRQKHLQAGEARLRELWDRANQAGGLMQVCPQCGLRPARAREFTHTESSVRSQEVCEECKALADREAKRLRRGTLIEDFGFTPTTLNLEELAKAAGTQRVALISLGVDPEGLASGSALVTQLARPVELLKEAENAGIQTANALGDWFEAILADLRAGKAIDHERASRAQKLLGDNFWLGKHDGRGKALEVVENFFLRESIALPEEWGLARHDGDRLALFALRRHASPARVQRLWDDLRDLWRDCVAELAGLFGGRVLPFSLDARGARFAIAASDADEAVTRLADTLARQLAKVRGGIAPHVSCVVMRAKFPLYLALDALARLDARIPAVPHQSWKVAAVQPASNDAGTTPKTVCVSFLTQHGSVAWNVDNQTADPKQTDAWLPRVIVTARNGQPLTGPDRIIHVADLKPRDEILMPPATFDMLILEGTGHRHRIAYRQPAGSDQLLRPHWVFGDAGRPPLLLETFQSFTRLVKRTGWDKAKLKGLTGEMVETYEKWVRDTPETLRTTGRAAWETHLRAMLRRYVGKGPQDDPERDLILHSILDGSFFDAVEWTTFVSKKTSNEHEAIA